MSPWSHHGEFSIGDEGHYLGVERVDTFIGPLVHIQLELMSEVLEMLLGLDSCCNGIQHLLACLLLLLTDGPVVNQILECLPIFTLKHHFQLFPTCLHGICFFGIDVEGFQEFNGLGENTFHSSHCCEEEKLNLGTCQ